MKPIRQAGDCAAVSWRCWSKSWTPDLTTVLARPSGRVGPYGKVEVAPR